MALTLKATHGCRLCGDECDFGSPAMAMQIGDTWLPRIARRRIMPGVCDACWRRFDTWRALRLGEARRAAWTPNRRGAPSQDAKHMEAIGEGRYGRFTQEALNFWLTEVLRLNGKAMIAQGAKRISSTSKSERRMHSRMAGEVSSYRLEIASWDAEGGPPRRPFNPKWLPSPDAGQRA